MEVPVALYLIRWLSKLTEIKTQVGIWSGPTVVKGN